MLLKNISVSSLMALTLLSPVVASAQGYNAGHFNGNMRRIVARSHQENREQNNKNENESEDKNEHKKNEKKLSLTGKATAISGTTVTLAGNNGTTYTVDASTARLTRRFGATMVVGDIQINDQLLVKSVAMDTSTSTAIKAASIQDMSLQAHNGSFSGTVQSVSGNSFVLQSQNRGLQTILTNSTTKITKGSAAATLSDLIVGATIKVDGVWDNTNSNVTANKIQLVVKQEDVHLNGTVVSIGGTAMTFTTDGKTYGTDVRNVKIAGKNYFGTDTSKLKAGDAIQVWGKTAGDSLQVRSTLIIDFSM
jgi:hypothetical protein